MKTLLDGFGEATDEVVALRAEVERLRTDLRQCQETLTACLETTDTAKAEGRS